ncbi:MAG: energy transducer TonB [Azoarcus sp.]|nr:energy transducer TonB [Azoarcus sp.]
MNDLLRASPEHAPNRLMPNFPGSTAQNALWLGLTLLLHGVLLFAMPRGAAQVTPPSAAPLMVSLLDPAPAQAQAVAPPPPQATPPKPRPAKPERPKRVTRKPRPVPAQTSQIPEPTPVPEPAGPAESGPAPEPAPAASQAVAAVSATHGNAAAQASGTVTAARYDADYLHNPRPPYPPMSRRLGEQGTVTLRAYVLPDGSAGKVEIRKSSGSARLDEAARTAIMKWRFEPARMGSKPVPSWVVIPFTWSLKS